MFSLINHRNRDFVRVVERCIAQAPSKGFSLDMAIGQAIMTPTRYYADYLTALRVCRAMYADKAPKFRNPLRKQQWDEFYGKVTLLVFAGQMSLDDAVARVLFHSQASRFFITAKTGLVIYHEMKRSNAKI